MATQATNRPRRRFAPAAPSWRRLTTLVSLLLLVWAALLPPGQRPLWWHYAIGVALILAFLGSWHGQHVSTTVRRRVPMALFNRRQRVRGTQRRPRRDASAEDQQPPSVRSTALEAQIVIHLRPHPHALSTPADTVDQMPWAFVTSWLDRYGVRAEALNITALTRTPPASGLRTDSAPLLTARTPQHRDTWLTYTLRAEDNVGALTARQTTMGTPAAATGLSEGLDDEPALEGVEQASAAGPRRATLADTVARRLVAELRERGWLATLSDTSDALPRFVPAAAMVRKETWTGTEYSDGFRAIYAVDPGAFDDVMSNIVTLNTKATWVSVTVRSLNRQTATVEACVGTLTSAQPPRYPLSGLTGFHGLHRAVAPSLTATGFDHHDIELPSGRLTWSDLAQLRWPTSAAGVPLGFSRDRQPVYLGLASPEPVRITVTGTQQFHMGIVARLALSGLPVAVYTAHPRQWDALASHGAAEQFMLPPAVPPPGAIVLTDGSREAPAAAITVVLRRPQSALAPSTTIVITQDGRHPNLFQVTTARGRQWLSTRLIDNASA